MKDIYLRLFCFILCLIGSGLIYAQPYSQLATVQVQRANQFGVGAENRLAAMSDDRIIFRLRGKQLSSFSISYMFSDVPAWAKILTASDFYPYDYYTNLFGTAIDVDGSFLAMADPGFTPQGSNEQLGAVYISSLTSTNSYNPARLVASDQESTFGFGLNISLNNNRIAVGKHTHSSSKGAVYIFDLIAPSPANPGGWTETAILTADDGQPGDKFGRSIALEGNRLVVGSNGAVYVFDLNGTTGWNQTTKLTPDTSVPDLVAPVFGRDIALSGNLIATTTYELNDYGYTTGVAHVFELYGATGWTPTATVVPDDGAPGTTFGYKIRLDGNLMVVGAPDRVAHDGIWTAGSIYLFVRTAPGSWRQLNKLDANSFFYPTDSKKSLFGSEFILHGNFILSPIGPALYIHSNNAIFSGGFENH